MKKNMESVTMKLAGKAHITYCVDLSNPDRQGVTVKLIVERVPRGLAQALRQLGDCERIDNGGDVEFEFTDTDPEQRSAIKHIAASLDADCLAHVVVAA